MKQLNAMAESADAAYNKTREKNRKDWRAQVKRDFKDLEIIGDKLDKKERELSIREAALKKREFDVDYRHKALNDYAKILQGGDIPMPNGMSRSFDPKIFEIEGST